MVLPQSFPGGAAAAKSRQSCLTLCDPIDGSLPGSCPWDSPGKNTGVGCHFLLQCMKMKSESEAAQSCPTPSNPMDCSPPGSSIHGIFQARVLEWGAIAFSAGGASGKELLCQCRRLKRHGFDPWARKIPWSRKWQCFLQYSFLENPMDRGTWQATVHRVIKSWTQLKWQHAPRTYEFVRQMFSDSHYWLLVLVLLFYMEGVDHDEL